MERGSGKINGRPKLTLHSIAGGGPAEQQEASNLLGVNYLWLKRPEDALKEFPQLISACAFPTAPCTGSTLDGHMR
jgi:hypothetical protein